MEKGNESKDNKSTKEQINRMQAMVIQHSEIILDRRRESAGP